MEILIAEDDDLMLDLLTEILEYLNFTVVRARDGQEAWEICLQRPVHLVITDWAMPRMDGLELCRRIRSSDKDHYTYIIIITGEGQQKALLETLKCGADDYIKKPFDSEELQARIKAGERILLLEQAHKNLNRKLQKAVDEVQEKNKELVGTLERLKETQSLMVQSEKMASIGQLAAGVAHEINNPVGFVSSNLKTLTDYQQNISRMISGYQQFVERISGQTDNALNPAVIESLITEMKEKETDLDIPYILDDIPNLIHESREGLDRIKKIVLDLKDFSHPGEDVLKLVDINRNLDSTLNIVWNEIKYKATVTRDYGKLPQVKCYPQQLNQVFMNLLINAAQAIEKQGEIHIATRQVGSQVEIAIRDTGLGIPEKNLTRIFDPFFTTKSVGKGTGLGLNVTYNILKKHKGSINVQSELGRGTTFTIRIPANGPAAAREPGEAPVRE